MGRLLRSIDLRPNGHLMAWILIAAAAAILVWICFWTCFLWIRTAPEGCDEFGYLYQSEAIRQGTLLDDHTERPFLRDLMADLREKGFSTADFMWMVAPHAYRYDPRADKVINQYPPGTALLLAPIPWQWRRVSFPILACLLVLAPLLLLVRDRGLLLAARAAFILAIVITGIPWNPLRHELRLVGSVVPTIPLLIAAGWFLRTRPALSLALVSVSVLFRIPNLWLLPPVALALIFRERFATGILPPVGLFFRRSAKTVLIFLACGGLWLMLYQWLLLGNPLRTTYPHYDQSFANQMEFASNLRYYFSPRQSWFLFHLIVAAFLLLLYHGDAARRRWLYWGLALAVWNYLFYVFHSVQVAYYPNASAMVLTGLVLAGMDGAPRFLLRALPVAAAACLAALCVFEWHPVIENPPGPLIEEKALFEKTFREADLVWADGKSGTVEYLTGKPGFRMNWCEANVRLEALRWFSTHGYGQAILLDDAGMNATRTLDELERNRIPYHIEENPFLHRIAWVEKQPGTPMENSR